jgi:hypothetical protein
VDPPVYDCDPGCLCPFGYGFRFARRKKNRAIIPMTRPTTPIAMPMPIPAFAPAERPDDPLLGDEVPVLVLAPELLLPEEVFLGEEVLL